MGKILFNICLSVTLLISTISFSYPNHNLPLSQKAFLCGSDEDGCPHNDPSSCVCIHQTQEHSSAFCLHFNDDNSMSCNPNFSGKKCPKGDFDEANEQACVSDALQAGSTCPTIKFTKCFKPDGQPRYHLQTIQHIT